MRKLSFVSAEVLPGGDTRQETDIRPRHRLGEREADNILRIQAEAHIEAGQHIPAAAAVGIGQAAAVGEVRDGARQEATGIDHLVWPERRAAWLQIAERLRFRGELDGALPLLAGLDDADADVPVDGYAAEDQFVGTTKPQHDVAGESFFLETFHLRRQEAVHRA